MGMGDRIKELRIKSGLTQEELGRLIGVQKSAIRKYEAGAVENIKRTSIKIMADAFGVTPTYLMGLDDRPATIALSRADNPYDDLPDEAQQEIENFIEYTRQKYKKQD